MLRSLWTAASGMTAQQNLIDIISNNLSNVNTTAFKKSRAEFQDLLYQVVRPAGMTNNFGTQYPTPIEIGHGVRLAATLKSFLPGSPVETDNPLDVSIQGDGFFQIQKPNGEIAYTRDGSFKLDNAGNVTTSNGNLVQPSITVPAGAASLVVLANGDIQATISGATNSVTVGSLRTVMFPNPAGLNSAGDNLYTETEASGQPVEGVPGFEGYGSLKGGFLEASNVQIVEEMVNMITAQRAYEINAKAITTSDAMLNTANTMKQ